MSNFIAYQVAVELVTQLRPIVEAVAKHDSNLADQLKRAATSVLLNLAEGQRRVAGNKRRAFEIAHGEAREVLGYKDHQVHESTTSRRETIDIDRIENGKPVLRYGGTTFWSAR